MLDFIVNAASVVVGIVAVLGLSAAVVAGIDS